MHRIHWAIAVLGIWGIATSSALRNFAQALVPEGGFRGMSLIDILTWHDVVFGGLLTILVLVAIMLDQVSAKTPGLQMMQWLKLLCAAWFAAAPFLIPFNIETAAWSHAVTGGLIILFASAQMRYETMQQTS